MKKIIRDMAANLAREAFNRNRLGARHHALCWLVGVNIYAAAKGRK